LAQEQVTDKRRSREKILLTGGSGLLGRRLAARLRERHEVTHFELADPGDGLPWVQGDLRDPDAVASACEGQHVVIHTAALHGKAWAGVGDQTGFEVNVMGTRNVLEAARKTGVWRVVFTSSIWATGHGLPPAPYLPIDEGLPREPVEAYGLTKKLGEQMCRFAAECNGLSTLCLRPGGIAPEDMPLPRTFAHVFGCVDVRDIADAHVLALAAPDDMAHEVLVITAESPLCQVEPQEFFADPAGTLDRLIPGTKRLIESGEIALPPQQEWYSIDKAKRLLGYRPQHGFRVPAE